MSATFSLPCGAVTLRRLRTADLPAFQAYRHDPEVGRYQGWLPQADDQAQQFLQEMATGVIPQHDGWCQLAIADAATDTLLGDIGLYLSADGCSAEIGFSLARSAQGKGHAHAALQGLLAWLFAQPDLQQVIAVTDERNLAAQALLSRLGFRLQAREAAIFRDLPCIELHYQLANTTR